MGLLVTVATLVVAALAGLFMAWAIGAGSSGSTPFAPAVGANAISVMRAAFVVGLLGLAGAVLQGANVSETVGSGLILFPDGGGLTPAASILLLLIAGGLVAVGVFSGYPIATAFTVTGAVVGVGLALGGQPAWGTYQEIVALWVATPFLGGGIAYVTARWLQSGVGGENRIVAALAALVGVIVSNVEFSVLGEAGEGASIAVAVSRAAGDPAFGPVAVTVVVAGLSAGVLYRSLRTDRAAAQRQFLLVLGGLVAFSAGGSQVGLAVGPVLPVVDPYDVPLLAVLFGGGLGLLAGSWTGAPRMIKALSQDYSSLSPRRSIAALIPAFAIAQTAVFFGIPVSFNEIMVSAIVGSGFAAGDAGISRAKMGYTVLAWVGSLALALAAGYAGYTLLAMV
ncbi:Sodium-dependent phosphate transporter protein [Halorhabdus tiamatea SARL4B]|uniref:Phosphate transporter n=1 Tax=Halorhabdus tiamatea SARL4B TaxID=1033806 RepID=F7PNY2_9EURY|nr:inorganic phosphate transporter [Halorhabdus tiamatea]ERJ05354.1 Sodium-dependent phosphate transporter protein [Halorhabdus tiamatea SARL4B]CCQ33624.1 phosphate transporter [Halorhabdus tiamatea SARL4B]